MKTVFKHALVLVFTTLCLISYSQEEVKSKEEQRKEAKERKKAEKKHKEETQWAEFQSLASEKEFIVELVQTTNRNLSPRTNFIAVSGDTVVVQFDTHPYFANNGLGGKTIYGTVSDYSYSPPAGKRGTIQVSFNITSENTFRGKNIQISVGKDGYTQVLFGTTFRGNFKSLEESEAMLGGAFLN